jgi:hypothetical protein
VAVEVHLASQEWRRKSRFKNWLLVGRPNVRSNICSTKAARSAHSIGFAWGGTLLYLYNNLGHIFDGPDAPSPSAVDGPRPPDVGTRPPYLRPGQIRRRATIPEREKCLPAGIGRTATTNWPSIGEQLGPQPERESHWLNKKQENLPSCGCAQIWGIQSERMQCGFGKKFSALPHPTIPNLNQSKATDRVVGGHQRRRDQLPWGGNAFQWFRYVKVNANLPSACPPDIEPPRVRPFAALWPPSPPGPSHSLPA